MPSHSDFSDVSSLLSIEDAGSEDEVDIFSQLAGGEASSSHVGKAKIARDESDEDGDEALEAIIQESIAKRNVKKGTEVLKQTKGKTKIAKGEVGGGSFQSMGACYRHSPARLVLALPLL